MKKYDLAVLDREPHSRGAARVCQRSDNYSDRFSTMMVVYDSHPFFKFAVFVPGRVLKLAEALRVTHASSSDAGSSRT